MSIDSHRSPASAQMTINFEPSLPERWPTLREYIAYRVTIQARPAKSIAGDMDMSPSTRNDRGRLLFRRVCLCGEVKLTEKWHAHRMCPSCVKVGKPSNLTIGRERATTAGNSAAFSEGAA